MKVLALLVLLLTVIAAFGQQSLPKFRTNVSEVSMPVTFLDAKGDFVSDIESSEVTVMDNRTVQKVGNFEISTRPLSMVILIDTSARLKGVLPNLRPCGIMFTQLVMGETGEAAVVTYDSMVAVRQGFTTNGDLIEKAFKQLKTGEGGAHMTDGVFRALGMLTTRGDDRRRVLVILAEGRDLGSEMNKRRALAEAQLENVSIYTVELSAFKGLVKKPPPEGPMVATNNDLPPGAYGNTPGVPPGLYEGAPSGGDLFTPLIESASAIRALWVHPMKTYAGGTGSAHINATSSKAVERAVQQIASELHTQYVLTYRPNNLGEQEFHTIEVRVARPGVKVRNRPGYLYIPSGSEAR